MNEHKAQYFHLDRIEDETGVSGVGEVAAGVSFPDDNLVVLEWTTHTSSFVVYRSLEDVEKIHGHNGKTKIVLDETVWFEYGLSGQLYKLFYVVVVEPYRQVVVFPTMPDLISWMQGHNVVSKNVEEWQIEAPEVPQP